MVDHGADILAPLLATWPVDHAAAGWVGTSGATHLIGETERPFPLASVTKALFAYTMCVAVEEGSIDLDAPQPVTTNIIGEPTTVRELLSHASGLAFDERTRASDRVRRRIYSNVGFDILGEILSSTTGFPAAAYAHEAVFAPLGMTSTTLGDSPAKDGVSTAADLTTFAAELLRPRLVAPTTVLEAVSCQFPDLAGVLPGFGRQNPNPWGLGFELRGTKDPHWLSAAHSAQAFGHFGQSGTFIWVDPVANVAGVALSDRDFGPWAAQTWPSFTLATLREARFG